MNSEQIAVMLIVAPVAGAAVLTALTIYRGHRNEALAKQIEDLTERLESDCLAVAMASVPRGYDVTFRTSSDGGYDVEVSCGSHPIPCGHERDAMAAAMACVMAIREHQDGETNKYIEEPAE
ncbi:hypothetical protein [Kordiimonas sp.]|uniref:hypothetical protein n=1 Tax=Kordiimonas sp. TaxID=1970157 RepID=UPI003A95656B